jgi:flagellar biosynthesis protein FliP
MKKANCSSVCLFMALFVMLPAFTSAQTDKAAVLKKLEVGVTNAKNNVARNERKLAIADSLIESGTTLINDAKAEIKAIDSERKALDKAYATNKKPLNKLINSKDKDEANQAKNDLKALDTKHTADSKSLDNRLKIANKKATTGNANISKGKTAKKTAEDALETAQAALETAQAKYDAVANPPAENEEEDSGKKKKK